MIHPSAIVEDGATVGKGTRVWAFAHILPGAVIGEDCNICDGVFVENDVTVGDRVTVKCGVQLWDGVRLEDDVFVGPNATFTNDLRPRSGQHVKPLTTTVKRGASIGANATILPGVTIGAHALIGAGTTVARDIPPGVTVVSNTHRTIGAVDKGVSTISVGRATDDRGSIGFVEHDTLPFVPRRTFFLHGVGQGAARGGHAHRECHQFIVCVSGLVAVEILGAEATTRLGLHRAGVYVPPMHWVNLTGFDPDTVVVVLASHPYDPRDYIRDFDEFKGML